MTMKTAKRSSLLRVAAAVALSCCALGAQAAATLVIVNMNAPGVGFNDPTPAAPVGGNTGTTVGEQRLIAFQAAADLWGATLTSTVPITIGATFEPLSCTATSAVLGSAGAMEIFSDFPNAPRAGTWYPGALASKLAGADQASPGTPHIRARFNSRLGAADCLAGSGFYLGLDNNFGAQIDLVTVLLHELGHGLGFQTFTDDETGAPFFGVPSVWDHFLVDNRINKRWVEMTDAERVASAISGNGLSWNGTNVSAAAPQVLAPPSNLAISGSAAGDAGGNYNVGDASFGPALGATPVSGQLMPVVDQPDGSGTACTALSPANARSVRNNIALVDRGTCAFVDKAKMVQAAGAIGMVIADNQPGDLTGMSGADPTIAIPSVRITQADGVKLKAMLQRRSRTKSGVLASLGINPGRLSGTDTQQRVLLFTPTVNQPGSSVSHYTTDAKPNQLMEPAINSDLSHSVSTPQDLTFPLLKDIGW
jgi:hypothetical protein